MLISGSTYATAWVIYVVCFVVAFVAFTRLSRRLRPVLLRQVVKGFLIVVFLTPVAVDDSKSWYAPAWLEGGYEMVLGDPVAASGAVLNLSIAAAAMVFILVIDTLWRRRKG